MFKLFLISIQFTVILLISLLILENSFIISFEIKDFIYSFSSTYALILLFIFFIIIFIFQSLYFKTKFNLQRYSINKKIKEKERGYDYFVSGMVALANKDYKLAIKESKKILDHIDDNPSLHLLLKSEALKLEKKYEDLNDVYEEMSKDKNTQILGYRGMMEQYLRAQDYHHAFIYGEKLFNSNSGIEKIYETLVNIIIKINNWHQLIIITDKAYSKKIISKKIYEENKSIALYEIAKIKQFSEIKESISLVNKALKLREKFPPYIKLYIDLLIKDNQLNYAKKYLKKMWKVSPHTEYRESLILLSEKLKIEYFDLIKFVTKESSDLESSKLLLIEASIKNKKWNDARRIIQDLLSSQPKKEVCVLMATIEEGENNDIQKKNSWLLRSRNGNNSNMWVCMISRKSQSSWSSISLGGFFNSLEWKEPYMLNETNSENYNIVSYEN